MFTYIFEFYFSFSLVLLFICLNVKLNAEEYFLDKINEVDFWMFFHHTLLFPIWSARKSCVDNLNEFKLTNFVPFYFVSFWIYVILGWNRCFTLTQENAVYATFTSSLIRRPIGYKFMFQKCYIVGWSMLNARCQCSKKFFPENNCMFTKWQLAIEQNTEYRICSFLLYFIQCYFWHLHILPV